VSSPENIVRQKPQAIKLRTARFSSTAYLVSIQNRLTLAKAQSTPRQAINILLKQSVDTLRALRLGERNYCIYRWKPLEMTGQSIIRQQ
jgi:hypothetical protein